MKWLIGVTAASVLSGCVWLMPVDSALKYSHGRHIGRIADRLGLPQERGLVTRQNGELTEVWSWRASRDLYQEKATYLTGEVKTDKGKMPFSGKSYTYEPAGTASCTISFSFDHQGIIYATDYSASLLTSACDSMLMRLPPF